MEHIFTDYYSGEPMYDWPTVVTPLKVFRKNIKQTGNAKGRPDTQAAA